MSTVLPPGSCPLQWMFWYRPTVHDPSPLGLWSVMLRRPLHSEVGVALVCDGPIFLQEDLHPALSGREIVDLPPIAEGERRDVLRDPEPASSAVAAVLDYEVIAVLEIAAPPDLVDAPGNPDFSAVRLDNGERRRWWLRTIPPAGVATPAPDDH